MAVVFILLAMAIMVIVVIVLPQVSGLTKVKYQPHRKAVVEDEPLEEEQDQYSGGYVPPDVLQRREESQKKKNSKSKVSIGALKEKMNYSKDDIPLKLQLTTENEDVHNLRRRTTAKKVEPSEVNDPNAYDYDIDELIQEDEQDQQREDKKEFQKRSAKSQQDLEELA